MSWYKALLLNFLSAITALGGFFIGVAIGTDSKATNGWLLAVIAGQFLYIALVDLVSRTHKHKILCLENWVLLG